jgi:hypothetical protein
LNIDEPKFLENPSEQLANVPELPQNKLLEILRIILTNPDEANPARFTPDGLREYTALAITFFLRERLREYLRRRIISLENTKRWEWIQNLPDTEMRALAYIEIYQNFQPLITPK